MGQCFPNFFGRFGYCSPRTTIPLIFFLFYLGRHCYIPRKQEAIHLEDQQCELKHVELNTDYLLRRFFDREILEDPEDYINCSACKKPKGCKAIKEFYLCDPPLILIIQLKRFKSSGFSFSKNTLPIRNLEEICIDKYVVLTDEILKRLSQVFEVDVPSLLHTRKVTDGDLGL